MEQIDLDDRSNDMSAALTGLECKDSANKQIKKHAVLSARSQILLVML